MGYVSLFDYFLIDSMRQIERGKAINGSRNCVRAYTQHHTYPENQYGSTRNENFTLFENT